MHIYIYWLILIVLKILMYLTTDILIFMIGYIKQFYISTSEFTELKGTFDEYHFLIGDCPIPSSIYNSMHTVYKI